MQAIKARCHSLIGPKAHMAAYKRPATVPVKKKATQFTPHHKNTLEVSLSIQLGSNSQDSEKVQEHEEQTLIFPELNSSKFHGIHGSSQRFNAESSSLSHSSLQFKREFTAKSNELQRDRREGELRRRGKETQRI